MSTTRTGSLASDATGSFANRSPESQPNASTVKSPPIDPREVDRLRHQIRKLETANRARDACTISTGCAELDSLLPDRGLVTGTITEWLAASAGCGAELLSLMAARQAASRGGAVVIVDRHHRFCPVAASAWGIHPENLVVIRGAQPVVSSASPGDPSLLWAIDQALRCPAVAAVWGRPGPVNERWQRRFQLSAEQSGAMGLFIRPLSVKGQPGWSEVQWQVGGPVSRSLLRSAQSPASGAQANRQRRSPGAAFDRFVSVRLLRVRSGHVSARHHITLKFDFTTGKAEPVTRTHERPPKESAAGTHSVHLAAQLAHPKTGRRRQRA